MIQPGGTVSSPTFAVLTTTTVGTRPTGVAVSPIGANAGDVYVTASDQPGVSVIQPGGTTVLTTITVGSQPLGVAVAP
ncbi:MAG: hypothetical protein WCI78_16590 [Mycobacterium sp.]